VPRQSVPPQQQKRRVVGALSVVLGFPSFALAQKSGRTYRICWLSSAAQRSELYSVAFVDQLRALGLVENRNLFIEFRTAEGHVDRLPKLAAELAAKRCDAFLAPGSEAVLVATKQATRREPIVMMAIDYDPVAGGHVASLSKPGGRITGLSWLQAELPAKRVDLLKEFVPNLKKLGVLADSSTKGQLAATVTAARRLGIELVVHEFLSAPYDYEAAFAQISRQKANAFLALASGHFVPERRKITALAIRHRLPSMYNNYLWTEAGGLLSYGIDFSKTYRRGAEIMIRVLQGANPADIPVEQASTIELALNQQTAKALSLEVSPSMRARIDRLIE
jgi:putative ABC transport system substrate-binding protein